MGCAFLAAASGADSQCALPRLIASLSSAVLLPFACALWPPWLPLKPWHASSLDALCCCRGYQQKNMASYISDVTLKQEQTAFVLHACYWHAGPGDAKVRVGGPVICLQDCAAAVAAIHRGATLLRASAPDPGRAALPCPALPAAFF